MPDEGSAEWCVQTRRDSDDRPIEHWVAGIDEFLATFSEPVHVRFTHGRSEYIDRFRDLDSSRHLRRNRRPVHGVRVGAPGAASRR